MPYQNSAGSTPVQSQYYNWQYFNHGMAKLQGIKPSGVNVNYRAPEGVNYFNSWIGDVTNWLTSGAEAYSEWRMNESKKNAAKYIEEHSLDEYKSAVLNNNIPFQYDTIAMSELKRGYGEITFNLAKQEWLDKVKSGEFAKKNLSDSEMDAQYFKFVRKKQSEVCKTLGYKEDDEDFVAGYYKNSPAARVEVGTTNRAVTDDWHIQQEKVQFNAKLQALASDSSVSPQQMGKRITALIAGAGTLHMNPIDVSKSLADAMETLVASGNYDLESMRVLGDTVIDPKTKKTIRDYFGDGTWNLFATKANNARTIADAESFFTFSTYVNSRADAGEVEELENQLHKYIDNASGKVSANDVRYKLLLRGIEVAKDKKEAILKAKQIELEKDKKEQIKAITAKAYVESLLTDPREQFAPASYGISNEDVQNAFNEILQDAAMKDAGSKDGSAIADVLMNYGFKSNAWYNPAQAFIRNTWGREMSSFKGQLLSYYKATSGGRTDVKLPDVPMCVQQVKYMLQKDSQRAWSILNGALDSDNLSMISSLATAEQYGISWEEAVKGWASTQAFFDKSLHPDGHQELAAINRTFESYIDSALKGLTVDGITRDIIRSKAMALYAINKDPQISIKTAIGDLEKNTFKIGDTRVPIAFFKSNSLDVSVGRKYTEAFLEHEYPTSEYSYMFSYADNALVIVHTVGENAGKVRDIIRYSDNLSRNVHLFKQKAEERAEYIRKRSGLRKQIFSNEGTPGDL